ncbi:hypothetical protein [Thalassiella azotivora]
MSEDHEQAAAERSARTHLAARGAGDLPHRPWLAPSQPADAGDLARFALWRADGPDRGRDDGHGDERDDPRDDDVLAGLRLLSAARQELDGTEAGLLFLARARGITWARIGEALGLRSSQAAQQRLDRLVHRLSAGQAGAP